MATAEQIRTAAEQHLNKEELFLVEVKESAPGAFDVVIDSDTSVDLDACAALNRAINDSFGEDEDFELTVMSAGIGQPLRLPRQFAKYIGKEVEIVRTDGSKIIAMLKAADATTISIAYNEKVSVEGKKRKALVTRELTLALNDTRSVCEHLTFK